MQKYGKIVDGELITKDHISTGFKKVLYAEIPENFNQETHYLVQTTPVDNENHIFVGVEMLELEQEDEDIDDIA